jgi:hypothetical protein
VRSQGGERSGTLIELDYLLFESRRTDRWGDRLAIFRRRATRSEVDPFQSTPELTARTTVIDATIVVLQKEIGA